MISIDIIKLADLAAVDEAAWRALQSATEAFASPLLGPDFARHVGAVRDDAYLAIWREQGRAVGFLAHHRRPGGFARPIGAPFCDYHAVISGPDFPLSGADVLTSAGLAALPLDGLVDPYAIFSDSETSRSPAYRIQSDGAPFEPSPHSSRNQERNFRRAYRKLEVASGPIRLQAPDHSQSSFDMLLGWKSDQLTASGMHDVLAPDWTRALMQALFQQASGPLQGLLIMLYAGERPVAGHFGVRAGGVYHPWVAARDPDLSACSPGRLHLRLALQAMPELGLTSYDLGSGADHWKGAFSNDVRMTGAGFATADTAQGRRRAAGHQLWSLPPLAKWEATGRLHRRLEVIAASELTVQGRLAGVVQAASGLRRQARRHGGGVDGGH